MTKSNWDYQFSVVSFKHAFKMVSSNIYIYVAVIRWKLQSLGTTGGCTCRRSNRLRALSPWWA